MARIVTHRHHVCRSADFHRPRNSCDREMDLFDLTRYSANAASLAPQIRRHSCHLEGYD